MSKVKVLQYLAVEHDKYNILTFPTHERYQTNIDKTGHKFFMAQAKGIKPWVDTYAPVPPNHRLLSEGNIPEIGFDFILSQNKFGQFQYAQQMSDRLGIPILSLEHTLPMAEWDGPMMEQLRSMRGVINVFISDYSIEKWGYDQEDESVRTVRHCIDTDLFSFGKIKREKKALSVVNDWINRDWCCGYSLWKEVTGDEIPTTVLGSTPGLSEPAKDINHLVETYQKSAVFLNTSTVSPVPTALLEAMSCGCAVVSTENCMIPEVIEHGVNGFMSNDPNELREYCLQLLNDEKLARDMGEAARKTIEDKFNVGQFVRNWTDILMKCQKFLKLLFEEVYNV